MAVSYDSTTFDSQINSRIQLDSVGEAAVYYKNRNESFNDKNKSPAEEVYIHIIFSLR